MNQYPSKHPQLMTLLTSLLASLALISACGGGSGDSADKSSAAATPSTPTASAASVADSASNAASAAASATSAASAIVAAAASEAAPSAASATSAKAAAVSPAIGGADQAPGSTPTSATSTGTQGAGVIVVAGTSPPQAQTSTSGGAAGNSLPLSTTQPASTAADVRIHVAIAGNDSANGAAMSALGADGPVKTIGRAQQLARAKLAAMQAGTIARLPVRVVIGPGEFILSSPLTFGPADSGISGSAMIYEAQQPRATLISGGVSLGSKPAPSAVTPISFTATAHTALTQGGGQLFVNGRRATLARQPNAGSHWFVQAPAALAAEPVGQTGQEAFIARAANYPWLSKLTATDKRRAIVNVMQAWSAGRHRLVDSGAPAGAVRITPRAPYAFLHFGNSQRYFVENTVAAFDAAGEWIFDNGQVSYIRQADEAGATVTAVLPVLEKLLVVQGEASRPVQDLQFIGLDFAHTRYFTPETGFMDGQSAALIGAALEVDRASRIIFENCNVSRTGGWGIWMREAVRDSRVANSTFSDLGAGAIRVGLAPRTLPSPAGTGANQLTQNRISETGKVFPGASAIWLGHTWDNVVSRNTVFNTTYTGISVGWSWGYADATSGRNQIYANLLYNIGQRQMADLGGIYTLGKSPGTVISNNIIREVRSYTYGAGAWGLYNDQGSTGILMENNIVMGTDNGAYHLNFGRDNILRGNVLAGGDKGEVRVTRLDTATNLLVQNNLLLPKTRNPFDLYAQAPEVTFSGNELSDKLSGGALSYSKCGTGCTIGSSTVTATATPTQISSTATTWNSKISAALTAYLGSPPGALLGAAASSLAANPAAVNPPMPQVAPAQDYFLDTANAAIGSRPAGLTYVPADKPDAIKIASVAAAPGGRCLAFNDSSAFTNPWDPHAYAKIEHIDGYSVIEFSLLIDASTALTHEWRDNDSPYKTGPSMNLSPAGVEVGGKVIAPLSVGQWTRFKLSTAVGGAGGATWRLELTRADGQQTIVDNLAPKSAAWARLNWLGFISNARVTSTPCLAALKATNLEP